MLRLLPFVLIASLAAAGPAADKAVRGDGTVRGKAGPADITVTTTTRLAGAIHSVTWNGKEFIDSTDHGRQLQSAASFHTGPIATFFPETYNPTEAGSRRDGVGPRSTSRLVGHQAMGNKLATVSRMAFWLNPGEKSEGQPAKNRGPLSDVLLAKQVTVGVPGFPHAIDYRVTFAVPATERHTLAQFEAVTGYMPAEFSRFWQMDPATGDLSPLDDGPGEGPRPVVFSTPDLRYAMGVWSPDQPSRGFEGQGYGRFRFPEAKVVKWNCVFRVQDEKGVPAGEYKYRMLVAVGTMANVRDTLFGLIRAEKR